MHTLMILQIASQLLTIFLAFNVGTAFANHNAIIQLDISKSRVSSLCESKSLRPTHLHKGLSASNHYIIERLYANKPDESVEKFRIFSQSHESLKDAARQLCSPSISSQASQHTFRLPDLPKGSIDRAAKLELELEVNPISISGPTSNRANLVFFGDGYTSEERDKFLNDSIRLTREISANQTFASVEPLLNFWSAFTPSNQSGVGTGGKPKDTAFGLYRDGTELRALYCSKEEVARAACDSMGMQCDYPILLGNDPLYGGLGGEFTITTSSLLNGALVLRHELGHSIIEVGEEYDGGFAYFGVNAADNVTSPFPWAQWLTAPDAEGTPRIERSNVPLQAYPWTLLNTSRPWTARFNASGLYARHTVRFSLSGLPSASDLTVRLDGIDVEWLPHPGIGEDRWHYDILLNTMLHDGEHEVAFELRNEGREGIAQLCSAEILEYGDSESFNSTSGFIGAFKTFSDKNETTYRPTNEQCLMRIVVSANFCPVCTEGLWRALLKRIDLVDDMTTTCESAGDGTQQNAISLQLLALAQFREQTLQSLESYEVLWLRDDVELPAYANQTTIHLPSDDSLGKFTARVRFSTSEVRQDDDMYLTAERSLTVDTRCT